MIKTELKAFLWLNQIKFLTIENFVKVLENLKILFFRLDLHNQLVFMDASWHNH